MALHRVAHGVAAGAAAYACWWIDRVRGEVLAVAAGHRRSRYVAASLADKAPRAAQRTRPAGHHGQASGNARVNPDGAAVLAVHRCRIVQRRVPGMTVCRIGQHGQIGHALAIIQAQRNALGKVGIVQAVNMCRVDPLGSGQRQQPDAFGCQGIG